jgi:hypothetical protein
LILSLDGDLLAISIGTLSIKDTGLGTGRDKWAYQVIHEINYVASEIIDYATAGALLLFPAHGLVRINTAGMEIDGSERNHLPEEAFINHLPGTQCGWVKAVLQGHLSDAAVGTKSVDNFIKLTGCRYQRLVTIDVLIRGHSGEQLLLVQVVGCADMNDVDVISINKLSVIACSRSELARGKSLLCGPVIGGTNGQQASPQWRRIIKEAHIAVAIGVNLANKTVADYAYTKF